MKKMYIETTNWGTVLIMGLSLIGFYIIFNNAPFNNTPLINQQNIPFILPILAFVGVYFHGLYLLIDKIYSKTEVKGGK